MKLSEFAKVAQEVLKRFKTQWTLDWGDANKIASEWIEEFVELLEDELFYEMDEEENQHDA